VGRQIQKALKVSLVVGCILTLINHYEVVLTLSITLKQGVRVALNFVVPFAVSLYSSTSEMKSTFQQARRGSE